jgi:hypothetical protein
MAHARAAAASTTTTAAETAAAIARAQAQDALNKMIDNRDLLLEAGGIPALIRALSAVAIALQGREWAHDDRMAMRESRLLTLGPLDSMRLSNPTNDNHQRVDASLRWWVVSLLRGLIRNHNGCRGAAIKHGVHSVLANQAISAGGEEAKVAETVLRELGLPFADAANWPRFRAQAIVMQGCLQQHKCEYEMCRCRRCNGEFPSSDGLPPALCASCLMRGSGRPATAAGWECDVDGSWVAFSKQLADQIENAYCAGNAATSFFRNQMQYRLDFGSTVHFQCNLQSGCRRAIRRCVPQVTEHPDGKAPQPEVISWTCSEWDTPDPGESLRLVVVKCESAEWEDVNSRLRATIPDAQLVQLLRVQNAALDRYYNFRREQMREKNEKDPVEISVWHGTGKTNPARIYMDKQDGFMMQYAISHQLLWGRGNYFAENASYSNADRYCHQQKLVAPAEGEAGGAAEDEGAVVATLLREGFDRRRLVESKEALLGLGRTVALPHRSSTPYHTPLHIRSLFFLKRRCDRRCFS